MTKNSINTKANDVAVMLFSALYSGTVEASKAKAIEAAKEITRQVLSLDSEKYGCEFTVREHSLITAQARRTFNELQKMPAEYVKANTDRGQARARQLGLLWLVKGE